MFSQKPDTMAKWKITNDNEQLIVITQREQNDSVK